MAKLTSAQIMEVKGKGFLRNRGTDCFSGRIVPTGTVFTADNFRDMSILAEQFGNGKLICTSRQAVEVPGIPFEKIDEAIAFANAHGLSFGGTGAKVRPITACKGTTCVYGNCDTQELAKKIHNEYYIGWSNVKLPHKFKISVGGCPNSCIKPSLNDFGVEGHKVPEFDADKCRKCKVCLIESACPIKIVEMIDGMPYIDSKKCITCGNCVGKCPFDAVDPSVKPLYKVFVGGTWGKSARMGSALSEMVEENEILPILEKSMLWFRENGYQKERFGTTIDRVGFDKLEKALREDDLLERKEEILAKELLQK